MSVSTAGEGIEGQLGATGRTYQKRKRNSSTSPRSRSTLPEIDAPNPGAKGPLIINLSDDDDDHEEENRIVRRRTLAELDNSVRTVAKTPNPGEDTQRFVDKIPRYRTGSRNVAWNVGNTGVKGKNVNSYKLVADVTEQSGNNLVSALEEMSRSNVELLSRRIEIQEYMHTTNMNYKRSRDERHFELARLSLLNQGRMVQAMIQLVDITPPSKRYLLWPRLLGRRCRWTVVSSTLQPRAV